MSTERMSAMPNDNQLTNEELSMADGGKVTLASINAGTVYVGGTISKYCPNCGSNTFKVSKIDTTAKYVASNCCGCGAAGHDGII